MRLFSWRLCARTFVRKQLEHTLCYIEWQYNGHERIEIVLFDIHMKLLVFQDLEFASFYNEGQHELVLSLCSLPT